VAVLQEVKSAVGAAALVLLLLGLSAACGPGPAAPAESPGVSLERTAEAVRTRGLDGEGAAEILGELCAVGPRLTGSPGAAQGVEWSRRWLESRGFEAWLEPIMVQHWVRGGAEAALLPSAAAAPVPLAVAALGWSVPTPDDGLTAKVLEVASFAELESAGPAARGRIVFFNVPMDRTLMDTFRAYGEAVQYRTRGASAAARLGAVAALVRSPTGRLDDHPHTGILAYEDGPPRIPAAAVSTLAAEALSARLREDPDVRVRLRLSCATLADVPSANVVGQIRGAEKPGEIVLMGAHLDSWDLSPGAHDDGAGCAQCLEALRLIRDAGVTPKRTIRAVLFMNEEFGASGGRNYAVSPRRSGERHIAAMESDRGAGVPLGFNIGGEATFERIKSFAEPLLRPSGILWVRPGGGGADVGPLAAGGTVLMSFMPDVQRYFDYHHSALDVPAAVHPRELELGAIVMAVMALALAEKGI
jgi:carboxypeptidase Q